MVRIGGSILSAVAAVLLLFILTQDLQIFAELMLRLTGPARIYNPPKPGSNAADFFATTADGERIHFRRWAPSGPTLTPIRTAILSHGNAGTMDDYVTIPRWLAAQGIATYVYDYRGYGLSTGWPSEQGIYRDIDAIWREAQNRDLAAPETTLAFGHSLGGGPASYLAETNRLGALMLASTFTSLPDRVALDSHFRILAPFVWTNFPNLERIARLNNTCLIVLHARNDDTMPYAMSRQLLGAYRGRNRVLFAEDPTAGHAGIIGRIPALAQPLLTQCMLGPQS